VIQPPTAWWWRRRNVASSLRPAVFALLAIAGCTSETAEDVSSDPIAPISPGTAGGNSLGARPDEWTWIDFPDSRCANGTSTGLAVNVHPCARHLVVFLEGGGACDSGQSCWVHPTAANIASGYDVQQLGSDPRLGLSLFDRGDGDNPFADASYVFVPYCTGDLHAGSAMAVYQVDGQPTVTYHFGARNLDLYLKRLSGSFPAVDHVWLVGESAGGFGTLFNQTFVANAFGVRTDVIDDSGPGIGASGYPPSWKVRLPPSCEDCAVGLAALFLHDRRASPGTRFAFLSFQVDTALPVFYGASQPDVADWLRQYERSFTELWNTRSFVAAGTGHVVLAGAIDDGTKTALWAWLTRMVTDSLAWGDVGEGAPWPVPGLQPE
jgi:hypothetical protein